MMRGVRLAGAIGAAACGLIAPVSAQTGASVSAEAMSQEVRRGLSWSEGRAAIAGAGDVSLLGIDASARIVTLRGSDRHGGADGVADLALGTGWSLGGLRLQATATGHLFSGARGKMDYVELGGSASYGIGPLSASVGVIAAPSQHAIGGSNVYTYASANAGIPGTPFTVLGEIGHSSGSVDDADRAARLRPGGDYTNWRLGLEHRVNHLTIGVDYIGTNVSRADAIGPFADARHAGDKIVGRVGLSF